MVFSIEFREFRAIIRHGIAMIRLYELKRRWCAGARQSPDYGVQPLSTRHVTVQSEFAFHWEGITSSSCPDRGRDDSSQGRTPRPCELKRRLCAGARPAYRQVPAGRQSPYCRVQPLSTWHVTAQSKCAFHWEGIASSSCPHRGGDDSSQRFGLNPFL